ncbi:MAG: DUF1858 domain-containing protein [Clostridiales bacterium]|jgi:hybrid cluster-associated redox disulfide protein|nr:DUF1858 domain-containing protein [Clostridiales bacterium]
MAAVTKDMTIFEVIQKDGDVVPVFFGFGMHCLGCPISRGETIEQAAAAHGVAVEDMLAELNDYFDGK